MNIHEVAAARLLSHRAGLLPMFTRGIERVVSELRPSHLPESSKLAPASRPQVSRLQILLRRRSTNHRILELVEPDADPGLMNPATFESALAEAFASLKEMQQLASTSVDEHAQQVLLEAEKVLLTDQELRDLRDLYRKSLIQG